MSVSEVRFDQPAALIENNGVHFARIKSLIPAAIKEAPVHRLKSMKDNVAVPSAYQSLPLGYQTHLKQLLQQHWRQQAELDAILKSLEQDIQVFAKPLLVNAIKTTFDVDLDVDTTTLTLDVADKILFGIDTGATRIRHSSLLDAALHNFEEFETSSGAFRQGSGVYTVDDAGNPKRHTLTVEQFSTLCRTLDIGAQYQKHIKSLLKPADAKAQTALKRQAVAVEKSGLALAAMTAYMASDIGIYSHGKIHDWVSGKTDINYYGKPLQAHRIRIMGLELSGIVLFSAVADKSFVENLLLSLLPEELVFLFDWSDRVPGLTDNVYEKYKLVSDVFANGPGAVKDEYIRRADFHEQNLLTGSLIAYVPDDPVHPLKEYASLTAFMKTLITQLLEPEYQQFFSRFVAQKDKPRFFKRVNERLKTVTWHQREPLSMGPWWRETPIENPNVEPITVALQGDLWTYLYRQKRDKAIADARLIAVPTNDEDAKTRWNRLVSYLDIGWNVFNFAVMLVPGMGEVMLGVMMAQLMAEFAEGIEDWSKGDRDEAAAHINSVLINFAQLALMSAGHVLPSGAAPIKASPFVDNLKPVSMPDGHTRLWNPDLTPYEHAITLPEDASANELGLFKHNGDDVLRLEDKHYVVKEDPLTGKHRMRHPTRSTAYAPEVEHNTAGAWKTELDRPLEWDKAQILRRLNPMAASFSDTTLEQVLNVSGIDENALRRLHAELELPAPLLIDTLERFKGYTEASTLGAQIRAGAISENLAGYLPGLMTELPRWPEAKAIRLEDPIPSDRASMSYGNANATPAETLTLTPAELKSGMLESRVLENLDEREIEGLLGKAIASDKTVRIEALRSQLAQQADRRTADIFESLYKDRKPSTDARVALVQDDFPAVPRSMAKQLLADADAEDLRYLKEKNRIPLRLREQIKNASNQVRMARAYEGLYLEQLQSTDTFRLALGSLEKLPGWSPEVRLELRAHSFSGELLTSIGAQDAPIRKVLILDEDGRFHARDETDQHLHGASDFYSSLLHALPDAQREALGYEIFEGAKLKETIQRSPLAHDQFEQILQDHPVRKPAYDPQSMRLHGGMPGYPMQQPAWDALTRRASSLYPAFTEAEIDSLLSGMGDGLAEQGVRALESEFDALNRSLQTWANAPTRAFRFGPAGVAEATARHDLYKAIRQCWQRTGPRGIDAAGISHPQALFLDDFELDQLLTDMPMLTGNFDHVTTLSLRNAKLSLGQQRFLAPFQQLRRLDMAGNRLTALPKAISDMPFLCDLMLTDNDIVLTRESAARLRAMKQMRVLKLDGNPLGQIPDISQMPNLLILALDRTGIDAWPVGLFAKLRPRNMFIDLRNNPIRELPAVAPGSMSAELIARTNVSREPDFLSAENLAQLRQYIESVGFDPDRPYPPRGAIDSSFWEEGITLDEWNARQSIWDAVEDEFGSEPFFNELRKLTQSADFMEAEGGYKADLTAKVWRMLKAMEENTALREKIFEQASVATTCADAGAQFFNAMGVEVMVHEAYALANTDLVEAQLLELARGKSRLDELGTVARQQISERLKVGETYRRQVEGEVTGTIDEVEVHMAYMTDLAERLDLPWQSRGMLFRGIAGVTRDMIENAYERVVALEDGELLAQRILEQPSWKNFLEKTYREEISALKTALMEEDDMTQFEALQDLEKTLTQQAIDRAKLQRVEVPLVVLPSVGVPVPEVAGAGASGTSG